MRERGGKGMGRERREEGWDGEGKGRLMSTNDK